MSKRLQFDIELTVSDDIDTERAAEVLKSMLVDLQQDDNYHEVLVIDNVTARDEAAEEMIHIIDELAESDVDKAIEALEALEKDDE